MLIFHNMVRRPFMFNWDGYMDSHLISVAVENATPTVVTVTFDEERPLRKVYGAASAAIALSQGDFRLHKKADDILDTSHDMDIHSIVKTGPVYVITVHTAFSLATPDYELLFKRGSTYYAFDVDNNVSS
jgi:hypothetical protein